MTLAELMIYSAVGAVVTIALASTFSGCSTDSSEAIRTLEASGFTKNVINDSGHWASFNGCDSRDKVWYDVTSVNPIGKTVNVVVCCGGPFSFKGCTIRVK